MKTIYGLKISNGPIRYIGQTKLALEDRRKLWISNSKAEHRKSPIYQWVRELVANGKQLQIVELELSERFDEAESEWIARTPNLLNIAKGGPGCPGVPQSQATREKRAASIKKQWELGQGAATRNHFFHTEEMRAKMSHSMKQLWEKKKHATN